MLVFLLILVAMTWLLWTPCYDKESYSAICYLLSTLAQAQAAIMAIVVTVTLIGFQFSSPYPSRMMDLLLGYKTFWIVSSAYGISISFDFLLLGKIVRENLTQYTIWIQSAVIFSLLLFLALFQLTFTTMRKINPLTVINDLAVQIDKSEKRIKSKLPSPKNALIPLFDVVKRAIAISDFETAKYGISKVTEICLNDNQIESSNSIQINSWRETKERLLIRFYKDYSKTPEIVHWSDVTLEVCKSILKAAQKEHLKSATDKILEAIRESFGSQELKELVEEDEKDHMDFRSV
jgi:hypothetical protein